VIALFAEVQLDGGQVPGADDPGQAGALQEPCDLVKQVFLVACPHVCEIYRACHENAPLTADEHLPTLYSHDEKIKVLLPLSENML
jgi:hypothetical protein